MKLQTINANRFGSTLLMSNKKVKWSDVGIAEVDDEFGTELLAKFGDTIFPEGKVPSKDPVSEVKEDNSEELEQLKTDLEDALEIIKDLEEQLKEKEDVVVSGGVSDKNIDVIIELSGKKKGELVELSESLNFPAEEWEELNQKDLAIYIIKKTLNGDSNAID